MKLFYFSIIFGIASGKRFWAFLAEISRTVRIGSKWVREKLGLGMETRGVQIGIGYGTYFEHL